MAIDLTADARAADAQLVHCVLCGHVGRYEVCAACVKRTGQTSERCPLAVMPDSAPAEDDEYEEWRP